MPNTKSAVDIQFHGKQMTLRIDASHKILGEKTLKAAYDKFERIHRRHLSGQNVKMPQWGTAMGYWLAILAHFEGTLVHKDYISNVVRKYMPDAGADQQVRHLKRSGWNLVGKGGYHGIDDPYQPHPGYEREQRRQERHITAGDFTEIKKIFNDCCATCGAVEGEPDPRYGDQDVKLEKGHRDPAKPMEKDNIIPQCQFCNRAYRDDFVFDKKGRVRAVASTKPVKRARAEVKDQIRDMLNKESKS